MTRPLDRRQFLHAGAAAALALTARAGAAPADDFGGFTVGVQSYTFRNFDLEQALKRIQDAGLKYVEFFRKHAPIESTPAQLQAVKKLCGEYGITPIAFGV
jgi:inosose dehydratase